MGRIWLFFERLGLGCPHGQRVICEHSRH